MKVAYTDAGITVSIEVAGIAETTQGLVGVASSELATAQSDISDLEQAMRARLLAALPKLAQVHQSLSADLLLAYASLLRSGDSRARLARRPRKAGAS